MAGNGNSGRKPKPTLLKVVEGKTYRLSSRKAEPIPEGDLVEAPDHFDQDQREAWDYAIMHAPAGLLKRLDQGLLAAWCVAQVLHRDATKALQNGPKVVKSPNGTPMQSPWLSILNRQAGLLRAIASDLGFSPAARTRISLEEGAGDEDPAERHFRDRA